jgi:hypothetical protein
LRRALVAVAVLFALAGCGQRDPFDDPYYAAECHGPPLRNIEARNDAMEKGYTVSVRFGCIENKSWEEVERANQRVAEMIAQAEREVKEAAARPPESLSAARQGFHTSIRAPASGTPLPTPPRPLFVRSDYTGGEGRTLAAFVTPDPQDGERHPAIIWITGGDSSTLEDFWSEGPPDNDQSASAFRKAGVVMMFPTLRGGNTDRGQKEFFFGEVDDIHAAANHLAKLSYVDPARLYLGGHSTGGTLALLTAETGGRFIAVFAFGPVSSVDRYPNSYFPMDSPGIDRREVELRSPGKWTAALSTDTYVIEGMAPGSNFAELEAICDGNANPRLVCSGVPGATHFSVLQVLPIIASNMVNGDGRTFGLRQGDFKLPVPKPAGP